MALSMTAEVYDLYVKFVVVGEFNLIGLLGLITQVRSEADRAERPHILVDMTHVTGDFPDDERVTLGKEVARVFGSWYRLAVVAKAEKINNLAKVAAVISGAKMNVLSSEDEAVRWLTRKDPASP